MSTRKCYRLTLMLNAYGTISQVDYIPVVIILGRELGPGGVFPNQRSRWKLAFSPLKHV